MLINICNCCRTYALDPRKRVLFPHNLGTRGRQIRYAKKGNNVLFFGTWAGQGFALYTAAGGVLLLAPRLRAASDSVGPAAICCAPPYVPPAAAIPVPVRVAFLWHSGVSRSASGAPDVPPVAFPEIADPRTELARECRSRHEQQLPLDIAARYPRPTPDAAVRRSHARLCHSGVQAGPPVRAPPHPRAPATT